MAPLGLVLAACCGADARVVARHTAQMAGLERAWFTQAAIDPATQSVVGAKLSGGALHVLTSSGVLQVLNAETGATLWSQRLGGGENTVVLGPAVMHEVYKDENGVEMTRTLCAATVGATLYVLRETERGSETLMTVEVAGSPAAAPAFGDDFVYVPAVSGRIMAYPFDQVRGVPFIVASPGALDGVPVVAKGRVIWTTARGELYGAPELGGNAVYRFDASTPLSGPPVVAGDDMYFATVEGVVHAMSAERAREQWRASVGGGVARPVVTVGGAVYVATETPAIWAFDAETGERLWTVEGLSEFVSATDKHVYAVTPDGAVGVLDRATGRPVASWPAVGALSPIANTENDRLYFVSEDGLIQCFHEEGLAKPYVHNGVAAPAAEAVAEDAPADEPLGEPAEDEAGFGMDDAAEEAPADEPEVGGFDPFATEDDEAPADTDDADDDPFADF